MARADVLYRMVAEVCAGRLATSAYEPLGCAMADPPMPEPVTRAVYEAALDALPPMVRAIFLLHRADGLSYTAIAVSLSLDRSVVETIAEALYRLRRTFDGYIAEQPMLRLLIDAEARLRGRHDNFGLSRRRKPLDDWLRKGGPSGDCADR